MNRTLLSGKREYKMLFLFFLLVQKETKIQERLMLPPAIPALAR